MPDLDPNYQGKLADPAWRKERARKGADAVNSPDGLINRLVAQAPALTAEQRDKLAALLRPAPDGGASG